MNFNRRLPLTYTTRWPWWRPTAARKISSQQPIISKTTKGGKLKRYKNQTSPITLIQVPPPLDNTASNCIQIQALAKPSKAISRRATRPTSSKKKLITIRLSTITKMKWTHKYGSNCRENSRSNNSRWAVILRNIVICHRNRLFKWRWRVKTKARTKITEASVSSHYNQLIQIHFFLKINKPKAISMVQNTVWTIEARIYENVSK